MLPFFTFNKKIIVIFSSVSAYFIHTTFSFNMNFARFMYRSDKQAALLLTSSLVVQTVNKSAQQVPQLQHHQSIS